MSAIATRMNKSLNHLRSNRQSHDTLNAVIKRKKLILVPKDVGAISGAYLSRESLVIAIAVAIRKIAREKAGKEDEQPSYLIPVRGRTNYRLLN